MPSVGSTPTTTSPAPQPQQTSAPTTTTVTAPGAKRRHKHAKTTQQPQLQLQRQQPKHLTLQLQYQPYQPQKSLPMPPVTTTQPTPAGVFIQNNNNHSYNYSNNNNNSSNNNNNNNDMSPISDTNSYSSVDTNQTLLNSIANQRSNNQRSQQHPPSYSHKYSQFMIITPAVSIDRDCENEAHLDFEDFANAAHNNGNLFRLGLRRSDSSSDDSGHSSDNSFRSNYNPYLHHSRQPLLSNRNTKNSSSARYFYTFSSWRWCTLLCAAMRCFGAENGNQATYSSSFVHHRLRRCSSYNGETAYDYEHFAAPFKARKTRDHMNNITYEL